MSDVITKHAVTTRHEPIEVPFAIATETLPAADLALVSLTDASGLRGVGEAAPFPSLTYDDVETAARVSNQIASTFVGKTPDAALNCLAKDRDAIRRTSVTAYTGVESALLDLAARQRGEPLAKLWGSAPRREHVTDITLPLMPAAAVPGFWLRFGGYGFPIVKVKVSGRIEEDMEAIMALRRLIPAGTKLTLDGNQGYRVGSAKLLVERLAKQGVTPLFFEQPLPEDDWEGAAALTDSLGIPHCLDETVRTVASVERAATERAGTMINIKIMKSGVLESHAMIMAARRAGLKLMIGGMLESEIAMGISLQLAAGTNAIDFYDLDTPFFFKQPLTRTSPWHARSARLVLPDGPGHGLDLL